MNLIINSVGWLFMAFAIGVDKGGISWQCDVCLLFALYFLCCYIYVDSTKK